jgi:hypothetical protein
MKTNKQTKEDLLKKLKESSVIAYAHGLDDGIKKGRKDYELELMKQGKFHTSMNRKICYQQGRKDAIDEMKEKVSLKAREKYYEIEIGDNLCAFIDLKRFIEDLNKIAKEMQDENTNNK